MNTFCICCGHSDTVQLRFTELDFNCTECEKTFDIDDINQRIESLKRLKMTYDAAKLTAESVEVG